MTFIKGHIETQGTKQLYKSDTILLSDSNYYKYIFKKTEKIVCVVFYALENADKSQKVIVTNSVLEAAKRTLDSVLVTVSSRWYTAYDELYAFLGTLITLESHIRLAQAVSVIPEEIADLLSLEIASVMRSLRQYLAYEKESALDLSSLSGFGGESGISTQASPVSPISSKKTSRTRIPPLQGQYKGQDKGQKDERRRMIKDILSSNRQSTIKDISEKISKWSEKTVQREITALIHEGIITKEGERRWSRYSLVPGV